MRRQNFRWIRVAAELAVLVSLAGCAVGPDFQRPTAPREAGYLPGPPLAHTDSAGGEVQRFVPAMDIPGQWWTLFHSPPLNALIARALAANPDRRAAQAALRAARENVLAQEGAYYHSFQANFSPGRAKNAVGTLSPTLSSGAPIYSLYTAQVGVSYVVDVFGGNRRQVESLRAQAEFQRFQMEAASLTLTSNLVLAAVQEASLRAQIAASEKIVGIATELLERMRRQAVLGAIAMADVVAQQAALAQMQASLPLLRKQLAQQRNLLSALSGRFPSEDLTADFDLSSLALPLDLPLSLPSQLIEQRPDVRAAEASLHAASAQVGVAISDMLPQITLSATAGGTATGFRQMFSAGNLFWSAAGSLTQTLFDGGTLVHHKRAAEADLDQAAALYQSTVIAACQNVADTLRALQYDAEAQRIQAAAERAAADSLSIARHALTLGATSPLNLLNAEQTYRQAQLALVQARANRYADTVALFQALGGGWWNRTGVYGDARLNGLAD